VANGRISGYTSTPIHILRLGATGSGSSARNKAANGSFQRGTCSSENVFVSDRLYGAVSQFLGSAKGDEVSRFLVGNSGMRFQAVPKGRSNGQALIF
jgi:hypothetical protein